MRRSGRRPPACGPAARAERMFAAGEGGGPDFGCDNWLFLASFTSGASTALMRTQPSNVRGLGPLIQALMDAERRSARRRAAAMLRRWATVRAAGSHGDYPALP